jgi:hypothetical protein
MTYEVLYTTPDHPPTNHPDPLSSDRSGRVCTYRTVGLLPVHKRSFLRPPNGGQCPHATAIIPYRCGHFFWYGVTLFVFYFKSHSNLFYTCPSEPSLMDDGMCYHLPEYPLNTVKLCCTGTSLYSVHSSRSTTITRCFGREIWPLWLCQADVQRLYRCC